MRENTVIWKYTLDVGAEVVLSMPKGAQILSVAGQHERIAMWAVVDPGADREDRTFRVFGTGPDAEGCRDMAYLGTALVVGGQFVFHVFEDRP